MATLGLITVLYKSNEVLEDFIKSLSNQSYTDYHLYMVDNSSSEQTDKIIEKLFAKYSLPAYTHIKNQENTGVAKGNNQGIELALRDGSSHVILLNNDIDFPQTNLLAEMMDYAVRKNEDIIIPKIFYHGTRKIWLAGGYFIHYKGTSEAIGDQKQDDGKYDEIKYFNYAPTCFMLISKKVFGKIGLMDERYFVYYDDNDFIYRAIKNKFKILYLPSLEIFHKVSVSTGGSESLFSVFYAARNRVYFIRKLYKFPLKQFALSYAILTQSVRYLQFNKDKKKTLLKAFKDGFAMPVN